MFLVPQKGNNTVHIKLTPSSHPQVCELYFATSFRTKLRMQEKRQKRGSGNGKCMDNGEDSATATSLIHRQKRQARRGGRVADGIPALYGMPAPASMEGRGAQKPSFGRHANPSRHSGIVADECALHFSTFLSSSCVANVHAISVGYYLLYFLIL